jgi:glycosyltransferase involved in cell wall biosynthesis
LAKARGEYIAWCDSDDYWLMGKLKAQIEYFLKYQDCEIVFTKFENFFENEGLKNNPKAIHEVKIAKTYKHYLSSALAKRDVFEKCGNFATELVVGEDSEMVSRMLSKGVNINHLIDEIYYRRRLHGNNSILTVEYSQENTLLYMMKNLRKSIIASKAASINK